MTGLSDGGWWLAAALALGIAELAAPGVFLIFLAVAAGITGAATLAVPDLPVAAQLASFAAWSTIAVLIGRRWYRDFPVGSADALLNDRAARLVGETVIVEQAIVDGRGRVRVGDSGWPATGPDLPEGMLARVVACEGAVLRVEAAGDAPPPPVLPAGSSQAD